MKKKSGGDKLENLSPLLFTIIPQDDMKKITLLILLLLVVMVSCDQSTSSEPDEEDDTEEVEDPDDKYNPNIRDDYSPYTDFSSRQYWGPYNVHDPSCIAEEEWTYCFSTDASYGNEADQAGEYIQVRRSKDLVQWEFEGWAFSEIPVEARDHVTEMNDGNVPERMWAPFIMKVNDIYRLYYSVSQFGSNGSYIGLAESSSPDGPWEQKGVVVKTSPGDQVNAIDPTVVVDSNTGRHWFSYGSHWSGIYIFELDPETGKPFEEGELGTRIASSGVEFNAIEGPEIIYNEKLDYFYLFVSYGNLEEEYNIRVGRSKNPEGPYYDMFGNNMEEDSNNNPVLTSPYQFEGHSGWQGFGHNGVFQDGDRWFSNQQARLGSNIFMMVMHLREIFWTENGWPVFSPQRFADVPQDDITEEDLIGSWEMISLLPTSGGSEKNQSELIELNADGTIDGLNAAWEFNGDRELSLGGNEYDDLQLHLTREWDWENERLTIVWTGINEDGITIWGKLAE